MEWIGHGVLGVLGMCAGAAVSAGTFAFLLVIGVLPRMMCKANVKEYVMLIENLVVAGVLYGAAKSIFVWQLAVPGGHLLTTVFAISAGIFVGGIAAALAEILHTFPVMFRRLHIKRGLPWVMGAMAFGKLAGSLFYFWFGYVIITK